MESKKNRSLGEHMTEEFREIIVEMIDLLGLQHLALVNKFAGDAAEEGPSGPSYDRCRLIEKQLRAIAEEYSFDVLQAMADWNLKQKDRDRKLKCCESFLSPSILRILNPD